MSTVRKLLRTIKKLLVDIMNEQKEKCEKEQVVGFVTDRNHGDRRILRLEVAEEIDTERRKDKLVFVGIPFGRYTDRPP